MAPAPLSHGDLLKVTVTTPVETEEAVADVVERVFGQAPALYTDDETLLTEVSVFLDSKSGLGATQRARLETGLRRLQAKGVPLGRWRLKTKLLPHRNWAEAWKRHFKPLPIGTALLVKPTWSRRAALPGQAEVLLDPGLSFGTGHHPTTAFCLEQVVACRAAGASFLDIGTGSGILAIAAAKLGYSPIEAFDFDPEAVKVAKANAVLNGVRRQMQIQRRDLRRLPLRAPNRFDLVCANLLANLLIEQAARIASRVATGGTLVLAGILATEFNDVARAYTARGWRLIADRHVKEWRSGRFAEQVDLAGPNRNHRSGATVRGFRPALPRRRSESRPGRDFQHPLDGQAGTLEDRRLQLDSRREAGHAVPQFFERV